MLEKLTIKNYLLLKNIEIDFSAGFNIIIGETGAGKSILINALSLLLGERADYSVIEKNREKMVIEGLFVPGNNKRIEKYLDKTGAEKLEYGLILRRELYSKAYSRCFINDTPININDLKEIGNLIVDIHSQNEHQSLLKKETHIEFLDSYVESKKGKNFIDLKVNYKSVFGDLINKIEEYNNLVKRKNEIENKRSFLEFQLKEIEDVNPQPGEEEKIEEELNVVENHETIQQALSGAYTKLYEREGSVIEKIKEVQNILAKISSIDKAAAESVKEADRAGEILKEVSKQIKEHLDKISFEPEKVEEMRERLYKLQFLKKKYGTNIQGIIEIAHQAEKDLSLLDNFDSKIKEAEENVKTQKEKAYNIALKISGERKQKAKQLEKDVEEYFRELGLEDAKFKTEIKETATAEAEDNLMFRKKTGRVKLTPGGIDDVEFHVQINKGDDFTPLRKTASGGEVSRIMLAIKTVLAEADKINTLIFDEIDTGISGRIAQKAGRVIKKLSKSHQIIAVTHLAQIAAQADEHFIVEKETDKDTTFTKIRKLTKQEKVAEIARLISGEKITDASIKSAKQLIEADNSI